ncbi:MAG: VOC family protein [Sphingobacteriales bacterium]|nr:VOC family protein [Sphingobacteriales bacterium]
MAKQIYPCLWFEKEAKPAAEYYCGIFPNSRIINESGLVVNFELNGRHIMALNDRRPPHAFSEAFSFVIPCEDQAEIDYYWASLTANGGRENCCGWCADKFGISWQVIPAMLGELLSQPGKGSKIIEAFLKMKKIDIQQLKSL